MIKRTNIVDQFSTFLSIVHSDNFIVQWRTDYQLKKNIESHIYIHKNDGEIIANKILQKIRLKPCKIWQNHLASYLQEICYWTVKQVFYSVRNTINNITIEECFLWGNEALTNADKILQKYEQNKGSKITTYAQNRLRTIVKEKIYISQGWKLLTNWGLLKKISKCNRKKVLEEIGGLKSENLAEYLLVWQCFVDNYLPNSHQRNKSLSPPSLSQLEMMTNQYNILAKKSLQISANLTVNDFKNRIEFCGEKARLFVNPMIVEYTLENNSNDEENISLNSVIEKSDSQIISEVLKSSFENLSLEKQSILYLGQGLGLTQKEIIKIIGLTYPNFTKEQYQLSREIIKIYEFLLDDIIHKLTETKKKIDKEYRKSLIPVLKECLTEYLETEILALCHNSFQKISINQQNLLRKSYFASSPDNFSFPDEIYSLFINLLKKEFDHKLNLKLTDDSLKIWQEKFCHQHFNRVF